MPEEAHPVCMGVDATGLARVLHLKFAMTVQPSWLTGTVSERGRRGAGNERR